MRSGFNPRAREGRDCRPRCSCRHQPGFNSPRRRGGRGAHLVVLRVGPPFQPTRPGGARRLRPRLAHDAVAVSIHAPARGATLARPHGASAAEVSIHAPARGATLSTCAPPPARRRFNPRAREGRDAARRVQLDQALLFQSTRPRGARPARSGPHNQRGVVSIHAPARGATRG